MASDIRKVGVVGIGLMGSGIAQVAATKNFDTVVVDVSAEVIAKGMERIRASLSRLLESYHQTSGKSGITPDQENGIVARIKPSTERSDLLECDIIIEAVSLQKNSSFHPWRNRATKNSWFPTPHRFPSPA
jgi:3-hydroxybutyryl-CoA dehydrogenase